MPVLVRRATVADAESVAAVLNAVIAEGNLTAFDAPISTADESRFISGLGQRSALHVAERDGTVVGVQSIDLLAAWAESMSHVATMGTWLLHEARGCGLGRMLAAASFAFARRHGYSKILIQVLAGNTRALRFYRNLGFREIGVAARHVRLGDVFHDEVYLELHLPQDGNVEPKSPTPAGREQL